MWLLFQTKIHAPNSPILHVWSIVFVKLLWCLWSASCSIELTQNCDNNKLDWIGDVFFHCRRHICCCARSYCRIKSMPFLSFSYLISANKIMGSCFFHRHSVPPLRHIDCFYISFFSTSLLFTPIYQLFKIMSWPFFSMLNARSIVEQQNSISSAQSRTYKYKMRTGFTIRHQIQFKCARNQTRLSVQQSS